LGLREWSKLRNFFLSKLISSKWQYSLIRWNGKQSVQSPTSINCENSFSFSFLICCFLHSLRKRSQNLLLDLWLNDALNLTDSYRPSWEMRRFALINSSSNSCKLSIKRLKYLEKKWRMKRTSYLKIVKRASLTSMSFPQCMIRWRPKYNLRL
jgi:hypothetical protein